MSNLRSMSGVVDRATSSRRDAPGPSPTSQRDGDAVLRIPYGTSDSCRARHEHLALWPQRWLGTNRSSRALDKPLPHVARHLEHAGRSPPAGPTSAHDGSATAPIQGRNSATKPSVIFRGDDETRQGRASIRRFRLDISVPTSCAARAEVVARAIARPGRARVGPHVPSGYHQWRSRM